MNFLFGKSEPTVPIDKYNQLEKKYNQLGTTLSQISIENSKLKEYEKNITKTKEKFEKENEKIGQKLIQTKKDYEEIKVEYDKLKKEYDKLNQKYENLDQKYEKDIKRPIHNLNEEVIHFMNIAQETQEENNFYKKEQKKLIQLNKNLENENHKLKEENEKLTTQNKNLLEKINELNEIIQNSSVNNLNNIIIYDPKNNEKITSLEEIQNKINEYYNYGLSYYQELYKQNEILKDLQTEYNNLQIKLGEQNSANISIVDSFSQTTRNTQQEIQAGFDNLYQAYDNAQKNAEFYQNTIEEMQEEMQMELTIID